MDIKTCRFCRKSFRGFNVLCPLCIEQLDNKYIIVRNYLDKNRTANINQVAEETEIDDKSLLFLIREGRLSLHGEGAEIPCMKCGVPISSGKYCDKCKGNLVQALENTISSMESSTKPAQPKPAQSANSKGRLHILNDDR
jgi:uncharacterized protein